MSSDSTHDRGESRPARILRGPVTAWYSPRAPYPKVHLDDECDGLRYSSLIEGVAFRDVFELAEAPDVRPCRICALEAVLYSVLRHSCTENKASGRVYVTCTAQSVPGEPGTNTRDFDWHSATLTAQARLRRVARRFRLPTTNAAPGVVAHGMLPRRGVVILARNLRSVVRPEITELPPVEMVGLFWTFLSDSPPEVSTPEVDAWELAKAVGVRPIESR